MFQILSESARESWNKGKLPGQKPPLKLREIWGIRIRLQLARKTRDLALFNLAIDSKLRGCDLVQLRLLDIGTADHIAPRVTVIQQKTGRPVQFEVTTQSRQALMAWIHKAQLGPRDFLFPSRLKPGEHISTRQYARLVRSWVASIGLDAASYGTHSLRRTKPSLIYRQTKNLRAVQLLLGHTKLESTVRYLWIKVEDALELAETTDA